MCELYGIDTTIVSYKDYISIIIGIQPDGNRNAIRLTALQRKSLVKFFVDLPTDTMPISVGR